MRRHQSAVFDERETVELEQILLLAFREHRETDPMDEDVPSNTNAI